MRVCTNRSSSGIEYSIPPGRNVDGDHEFGKTSHRVCTHAVVANRWDRQAARRVNGPRHLRSVSGSGPCRHSHSQTTAWARVTSPSIENSRRITVSRARRSTVFGYPQTGAPRHHYIGQYLGNMSGGPLGVNAPREGRIDRLRGVHASTRAATGSRGAAGRVVRECQTAVRAPKQ